jgi:hypothetical protein
MLYFQLKQIILLFKWRNKDKKYYNEGNISPSMAIVLSQLFHYNLHPSIKNLYYKGKGYELLSCISTEEDPNAEQCPFLIDEDNMKIKAKKLSLLIWRSHRSTRISR